MGFKRKDILTSALASGYTYTRTGTGTRYTSAGLETDITANNGRFNHNRTTPFTAQGLMFEAASTNNLQRSSQLDNAYWTFTSDVTPTAVAGGYDGTSSAYTFTDANGVAMSNGFAKVGLSIALNGPCISWRAKYVSRRWYELTAVLASGADRAYCDIQNGTITNSGFTSVGVLSEGDGWYRFYGYTSGAQTFQQLYLTPRGGANSTGITGNGSVIYAQRIQLEEGATPSSTINTVASSVSRGLDICQITTPPVDTSLPFAMLVKYSLLPGASAGGPLVYDFVSGGGAISTGSETCCVVRFNGVDVIEYTAGGSVVLATSYDPADNSIRLGSDGSSLALNGCISEVQWWQGAMTDALMLSSASSRNFPAAISNSRFGIGSLGLGHVGLGQIGIKH